MKNIILFLSLLAAAFSKGHAQFRVAITGGPQWSSVNESNTVPGWDANVNPFYKSRTSLNAGFLFHVPINARLFFQPGILLSGKGRKYEKINSEPQASLTDTLLYRNALLPDYIDFPLNFGYALRIGSRKSVSLSTGPLFSLFRKGTYTTEFRSLSTNQFEKEVDNLETGKGTGKIRTVDVGWNARVVADLGKAFLTAYYTAGLSNFYTAAYPSTYRHQTFGLSLGIWLNKAPVIKPKDRDADGVPDATDQCISIPGKPTTQGCPDRDNDGITDAADQCPDQPGTPRYKGCPVPDRDKDGIDDDNDKCPDQPGMERYQGCPVPDSDRDGVNDELDQCPTVAGISRFNGCPVPDTDRDGINDDEDQCPQQPGTLAYNGCPVPDRDGDGLNDEQDRCPDQPGTAQENGCPEIKKEIVEKVNYAAKNIFFAWNSIQLLPASYAALDEVVNILQEHPQLQLAIGGHTDNVGSTQSNLEFSEKRANAVRQYFSGKGIAPSRLKATGYGETRPLAPNTTAAGRSRNRRVEMSLYQ